MRISYRLFAQVQPFKETTASDTFSAFGLLYMVTPHLHRIYTYMYATIYVGSRGAGCLKPWWRPNGWNMMTSHLLSHFLKCSFFFSDWIVFGIQYDCSSGGRVGWLVIRRALVQIPGTPSCMLRCPWARWMMMEMMKCLLEQCQKETESEASNLLFYQSKQFLMFLNSRF